jgi:hypothetical protein
MAQKWGGCHRNTMANSTTPQTPTRPSTAASAISGAIAPETPPTTTAWGVRGLSQIV